MRFPLAFIDVSPITWPHIFIAYAKKASSEDDSSSLPSADSKSPLAKLCPWYQSKQREKGNRLSCVLGFAASRTRAFTQALLRESQEGSRYAITAAV